MDLGLRGRVAIVAASSKGLGKAVAAALAGEGVHLALCARSADALEATARDLEARHGVQVLRRALDVTNADAVTSFVQDTAERFGRVDICVTNAGGPPAKNFLSITPDEWRAAVDLNLLSTLYFARAVIPHMQSRRWGRLITITSVTVKQPLDGLVLSNAVRAAVAGLVKSLANEFGKDNILVNNVCPGFTLTDRLDELSAVIALAEGITREEVQARWTRTIPLGRLGRPEEFGAFVALLCSEQASYVSGTSTAVDGGFAKGLF
jgi:3-oxoacyl-[acyl-carrier protein] reductase